MRTTIEIPGEQWAAAVNAVARAMPGGSELLGHGGLHGVHVVADGAGVTLTTTDTYRLAEAVIPVETGLVGGDRLAFAAPTWVVRACADQAWAGDAPVTVGLDPERGIALSWQGGECAVGGELRSAPKAIRWPSNAGEIVAAADAYPAGSVSLDLDDFDDAVHELQVAMFNAGYHDMEDPTAVILRAENGRLTLGVVGHGRKPLLEDPDATLTYDPALEAIRVTVEDAEPRGTWLPVMLSVAFVRDALGSCPNWTATLGQPAQPTGAAWCAQPISFVPVLQFERRRALAEGREPLPIILDPERVRCLHILMPCAPSEGDGPAESLIGLLKRAADGKRWTDRRQFMDG